MSGRWPHLELSSTHVDPQVARRLPRGLAAYYLALPVAMGDGHLTVVMAHPWDRTTLLMLEELLKLPLVPVEGTASAIREAIDRLWDDQPAVAPQLLCWAREQTCSPLADAIAHCLGAGVTLLDAARSAPETALTVACEGGYSLLILEQPHANLSRLARDAQVPILCVDSLSTMPRRILLVLRGHAPDDQALDWMIPLAQANSASITLLSVAPPILPFYTREIRRFQGLAMLLSAETEDGEHIFACARRLHEAGIRGSLKLRQGSPPQQIADELEDNEYDLIVLTAEAHGTFVGQVLSEIEARALQVGRSVLIVKPMLPASMTGHAGG